MSQPDEGLKRRTQGPSLPQFHIRPAPPTHSSSSSCHPHLFPHCCFSLVPIPGPRHILQKRLLNLDWKIDSLLDEIIAFLSIVNVALAIPLTLSPAEIRCFHITLQLLQISHNILYAYHCLEIMTVIRPATRSCYLTH